MIFHLLGVRDTIHNVGSGLYGCNTFFPNLCTTQLAGREVSEAT